MSILPARHTLEELCFPHPAAVAAAGGCGLCQREEALLRGAEESRIDVETREAREWFRIGLQRACLQAVVLRNHRAVMGRVNEAAERVLVTGGPRATVLRLRFDPHTAEHAACALPYAGLVGTGPCCPANGGMPPGASLRAISDELSRWPSPHALNVRWEVTFSGVQLLIAQNPGSVAAVRQRPPHTVQICQRKMDCDGYYSYIGMSRRGDPVWERPAQLFCGPCRFAALTAEGDWRFTDSREVALGDGGGARAPGAAARPAGSDRPPRAHFPIDGSRTVAHQVGRVSSFVAGSGAVCLNGAPIRLSPQQLPSLTVEATLTWSQLPHVLPAHPLLPLIVWAARARPRQRGRSGSGRQQLSPLPSPRSSSPLRSSCRAATPPVRARTASPPCPPRRATPGGTVEWQRTASRPGTPPCAAAAQRPAAAATPHASASDRLPADLLRTLAVWIPHPDNTAVAGLCSFLRWGR
eukprot:TRINITY_DN34163_c0_g1_i1.p1 TRINITY_DN34163_c0_g1~~TRINITY_DN34163_c0_g1_i1.p1  ORF type:complete len:468 (+),score=96.72 TRINITY_DN34163_c0_g1_i1:90-1493(+)